MTLLRKTIRREEDCIKRVNQRCLGAVPYIRNKERSKHIVKHLNIMDEKIDPDFKESIRIIRNKVERSAKEHGLKTLVHYGEDFACSGHLYLIRVPGITIEQRNDIIVKMVERGIACNVHYKPLPMMTAYKELGWDMKDFPNAYTYYSNEITLLLHTKLTEEDIAYAIQNFTEIVKEYI